MSEPITAKPFRGKMPGWELRPPEMLRKEQAKIGVSAFQKGFRNRPHSQTDLFFPSFDEARMVKWGVNPLLLDEGDPFRIDPEWPRYSGIDLSGSKRRGKCLFTIAVGPGRVRHLLDIQLVQSSEPEFLKLVNEKYKDLLPRFINLENNALQDTAREWAKEMNFDFWPKIRGVHTGKQKTDQERGLPGLDVQYSQYRWRITVPHAKGVIAQFDPRQPGKCACPYCIFIHDVQNMTYDDLDSTPDTVMAQWQADRALKHGERFTADSFAVNSFSSSEVSDAVRKLDIEQVAESYRLPIGVSVFDGQGFGRKTSRRGRFNFGRSDEPPDSFVRQQQQIEELFRNN